MAAIMQPYSQHLQPFKSNENKRGSKRNGSRNVIPNNVCHNVLYFHSLFKTERIIKKIQMEAIMQPFLNTYSHLNQMKIKEDPKETDHVMLFPTMFATMFYTFIHYLKQKE